MFCPKNLARLELFWRATARRRSPAKSFTLIPVIRLWGCENSFSNRENFSLFSNFIFCCWLWCLARTSLHKNKPNESDLIGIYEPDAKTQKLILKDGGYSSAKCRIELNADGKIEFTNMPDWWQGGSGESHKQLISTN